ncbi:MAG: cytochrome P450 [Deltaproteobacteria bacterium]|nr:cytochrome P450 [Deltaproteobacteria bacterium]
MVEFNPYDLEIHEDPYPTYRRLRDEAPCYRDDSIGFWALSRHADVLAAFQDPERFSSREGVALETVGDASAVMSFLAMDPPRQTRLRALVSRGFTPRRVRELEAPIRKLAAEYLDRMTEAGGGDAITDFAGRLPMDVVSEMLGVPPADRDELRAWADQVVHREEGDHRVPQTAAEASLHLLGYFSEHVSAWRKKKGDDLTHALISAEIDGDRLEDRDIIAFLFLMIIAGNETTTKLLGNALVHLSRHPDQRRRVLADPSLVPGWVEETLRYDASSQLLARVATRDVTLHGETIPKGGKVALLIGAANRDERVFDAPDAFDIGRDCKDSLAFGRGVHFCLGAALARLEAKISLDEILQRAPAYAIDEAGLVRIHSGNVRGFAQIPLHLHP